MCSANAKPKGATPQRLWHMLTHTGGKHGSHPPALFITRRSSATGFYGVMPTADPSCQRNTVTPKTEILTRDRLKARALIQFNRDLQAVERYVRLHQTLNKGRCSDA